MTTPQLRNVSLEERAWRIRRNALRMGEVQGQGYIAQALGVADVLAVSYFHAIRFRPQEPEWEGRDRFLLSIGHYAIALYAALIEAGILPEDEIETYGGDDSRMPMSGMAVIMRDEMKIAEMAAHMPVSAYTPMMVLLVLTPDSRAALMFAPVA